MTKYHVGTVMVILLTGVGLALATPREKRLCPSDAALFDASGGMTAPKAVRKVQPGYPEEAREDKVTGSVLLNAVIDTAGEVADVYVVEDPDPRLSEAAVEAVRQWSFEPALDADGKPVKVCFALTIKFLLE